MSLSGLDPNAVYVAEAHLRYRITNNTAQFVWAKFTEFSPESYWIPLQTNWEIVHKCVIYNTSTLKFEMSPQGAGNSGVIQAGAFIRVARIDG